MGGCASAQHSHGQADVEVIRRALHALDSGNRSAFLGCWSDDCILDASAVMNNSGAFRVYHRKNQLRQWLTFHSSVDWQGSERTALCALGDGRVAFLHSYTPKVRQSGKEGGRMTDSMVWTLRHGKVVHVKHCLGDPVGMDALLGPEAAVAPGSVAPPPFAADGRSKENVEVVKAALRAWGSGNISKFMTLWSDSGVQDSSAVMNNVDAYRVYRGKRELLRWLDFLGTMELQGFEPSGIFSLGGNKVLLENSYTPKVKATGKMGSRMRDYMVWTIAGGKITHVKYSLGDPVGMDSVFAP